MHLSKHLAVLICAAPLSACATTGPDSVKYSKDANDSRPVKVADLAADFLVEMVDARLMDYQEGKLAAERGTRPEIRDYGKLMMRDQTALLAELKSLAATAQVTVPSVVGAAKRDGLDDLMKLEADKFDKGFIKSIRIDHERDVREFEKATKYDDSRVANFAAIKLPLIRSHLERIEAIDKNY